MTYNLEFLPTAYKEWNKSDNSIKQQFKKKLTERLKNPCVIKDKLSGDNNLYKIKLRNIGYRLVYHVSEEKITVTLIAIGKREKSPVYQKTMERV